MRTAGQTCMFNIKNFVINPKRKFPFHEIAYIKKMIEADKLPPTAVEIYRKAIEINK